MVYYPSSWDRESKWVLSLPQPNGKATGLKRLPPGVSWPKTELWTSRFRGSINSMGPTLHASPKPTIYGNCWGRGWVASHSFSVGRESKGDSLLTTFRVVRTLRLPRSDNIGGSLFPLTLNPIIYGIKEGGVESCPTHLFWCRRTKKDPSISQPSTRVL